MVGFILALCLASPLPASPSADEIMARVACNQDRALRMRSAFVYHQKLWLRMHRGNGKLARDERREYTVTPTAAGFQKELTSFQGKYLAKGKEVSYEKPGFQYKGTDVDGQVLNDLDDSLTSDKESRDGLATDLFPLTSKQQKAYEFHLVAKEAYRDKPVYRIAFEPKEKQDGIDLDSGQWKGETLIDATEYQPLLVATKLASKVPFIVRTLLGTNLQGLGFSVTYRKFADGVWFPVSYGGEFRVKVLFFYTRNVSISLENNGFQRADVTSKIAFGGVKQ